MNLKTKLTIYDKYLIEQIALGKLRQFLCKTLSDPKKRLQYNLVKKDLIDNDVDIDDLYLTIVLNFFQTLNFKFSDSLYKQLIKMIRTYTFYVLNNLNLINYNFLPGNPIMSVTDYITLMNNKFVVNNLNLYTSQQDNSVLDANNFDSDYLNNVTINPLINNT